MRHADAELQLELANERLERLYREIALAKQLPVKPTPADVLRRRAGEALIQAGQWLLPAHRSSPAA